MEEADKRAGGAAMTTKKDSREKALEAAREVFRLIKSIQGKQIPIRFPSDEVAMTFSAIIERTGTVARYLLSADGREAALEDTIRWALCAHAGGAGRGRCRDDCVCVTEAAAVARALKGKP